MTYTGYAVGGTFILRELEPGEELPAYAPDLTGVAHTLQRRREEWLEHALGLTWREKVEALGRVIAAHRRGVYGVM